MNDNTELEGYNEYSAPLIVLKALRDYLQVFIRELPELNPLYARIDDLEIRLLKMNEAHEEWLQDRYAENNQA